MLFDKQVQKVESSGNRMVSALGTQMETTGNRIVSSLNTGIAVSVVGLVSVAALIVSVVALVIAVKGN
jgi:hypothetical protein